LEERFTCRELDYFLEVKDRDVLEEDILANKCYELKPLELDNRITLVLSNTRELDRELFYKLVYLI